MLSAYNVVFVILVVHFYICTIEMKILKINQRMTLQWTLSFLDAIYQVEILILALREQYTMNICYKKFILRKQYLLKSL